MSKSNTFENKLLRHIFLNEALALIGDAVGLRSSTLEGNLYIGLANSDPGEGADQTTNEASYSGYARIAVPRNSTYWDVTGNLVENLALIEFGEKLSGSAENITHFTVGTALSGAGMLLYSIALTPTRVLNTGGIPKFDIGTLNITEE